VTVSAKLLGRGEKGMEDESGSLWEWLIPSAFFVCAGWAIWHAPAYILDFIPPSNPSLLDQMSELHLRKDVTPGLPGLFGGFADGSDWAALILLPIIFVFGARTVRCAHMEYQQWRPIDRVALFVGRVTMILIISMTAVMLYEVFLRYVLEAPTLWANELTLWIAGFVFLFSGLYAMQQRCHIRIFLLYDYVPRWMQHTFDVISVLLLWVFASFLIYGSFYQVFVIKFYKWEMFGTAFDPPIPATVQPMILIVISLIAVQAAINLISDWKLAPIVHSAVDDIDEDEIEAIKRSVGGN
jgi:TRAP-type mannitol/chloroaromatic compound transport system permease small subunit